LIQTEKPSGDAPVAEVTKLLIPKLGPKLKLSRSRNFRTKSWPVAAAPAQLTLQEHISSQKILDEKI
jgi:hypothetical protein